MGTLFTHNHKVYYNGLVLKCQGMVLGGQRIYVLLLLCRTSTIHQWGRSGRRGFHAAVRSWRLARSWGRTAGSRQVCKIRWCP